MSPENILWRKWITHVLIWSLPLLWTTLPYCHNHMANSVLSHDFTAAPVSVSVISKCKIQQTEAVRCFSFVAYVLLCDGDDNELLAGIFEWAILCLSFTDVAIVGLQWSAYYNMLWNLSPQVNLKTVALHQTQCHVVQSLVTPSLC